MTMKHPFLKALLAASLMGLMALSGARADNSQTNSPIQLTGTPEVTFANVSCNTQKFRVYVGIKEVWNGVVENGTLHYVSLQNNEQKTVPLSSIDRTLTSQLNRERKVNLNLGQ